MFSPYFSLYASSSANSWKYLPFHLFFYSLLVYSRLPDTFIKNHQSYFGFFWLLRMELIIFLNFCRFWHIIFFSTLNVFPTVMFFWQNTFLTCRHKLYSMFCPRWDQSASVYKKTAQLSSSLPLFYQIMLSHSFGSTSGHYSLRSCYSKLQIVLQSFFENFRLQ